MESTSKARPRAFKHAGCPALPSGDLWVFGYGSLMWDPGFGFVRSASARLHGYHRAFCVYSTRYRGTPERPGLVLGLDRGGCCRGIAFLIAEAEVGRVLENLWAREMPRLVYRPRLVPVDVGAEKVNALTFRCGPDAEASAAGTMRFAGRRFQIIAQRIAVGKRSAALIARHAAICSTRCVTSTSSAYGSGAWTRYGAQCRRSSVLASPEVVAAHTFVNHPRRSL